MFGQNGFRPMGTPLAKMGQTSAAAAWWPSEGLSSVQAWDALISRVSKLANADAQARILEWIGRGDIPGTPAERYQVVVNDLNSNVTPKTSDEVTTLRKRVDALESYTGELEAKVKAEEQSNGTLPASPGAGSTPEHEMMMECIAGGVAVLSLFIVPLVVLD